MRKLPQYWLNGEHVSHVSVMSRAYHYGDGCFTTGIVQNGIFIEKEAHVARLIHSMKILGLTELDWNTFNSQLSVILTKYKAKSVIGIKMMLSRGEGGRGYAPASQAPTQIMIQLFEYPAVYHQWQRLGIQLTISQFRLGHQPYLAGVKHNNRLEQVLIKQDLEAQNSQAKHNLFDDALVCDLDGNVIETSSANIFWVIEGELFTPDLSRAGVDGLMRQQVLNNLSEKNRACHIGDYSLQDIQRANEVFISNALHGIVPIYRIKQNQFEIGPITRQLQESLNRV